MTRMLTLLPILELMTRTVVIKIVVRRMMMRWEVRMPTWYRSRSVLITSDDGYDDDNFDERENSDGGGGNDDDDEIY